MPTGSLISTLTTPLCCLPREGVGTHTRLVISYVDHKSTPSWLIIIQFFPILGRLVVDRLEGKLDESLTNRFAFDRVFDMGNVADRTRSVGVPKELDLSQLSSPGDLLPPA